MADVGDQNPPQDPPTAPFRKVVLPAEETVRIPRPAQRPYVPPGQPGAPPAGPPPTGPHQVWPQATGRQAPRPQAPYAGPQRPAGPQGSGGPQGPAGPKGPGGPSAAATPQVFRVVPPPPPRRRGLGDIPIKVVYLVAAIVATVLAVLLIFVVFSGDVPTRQTQDQTAVSIVPVPPATATPTPTVSEAPLPAVPESKKFAPLSGKASATKGTVTDKASGISYPRLGGSWSAKSFPPFSVAQRVGKVEAPYTVAASAMLPGDAPAAKPSTDADYRAIAVQAARWTLRTQYPEGATLTAWTASRKVPVGKGWTLAFTVSYPSGNARQVGQAMVTVVEVGKTKPAMLVGSIPQSGKAYWRDLNTLADKVRPL
ncbi:hypothetical protein SAMN05660976_06011 [Nonomuraea pusilla]|uniref:Uncharacterized protein n=1 Tax=Nonomuraea pusilla TaxID=46177 RepID=A0A1H8B3L9_9ACTN|nr:hypothetical protein SAMN05660976_06011 [Nonomuraea pusilla]